MDSISPNHERHSVISWYSEIIRLAPLMTQPMIHNAKLDQQISSHVVLRPLDDHFGVIDATPAGDDEIGGVSLFTERSSEFQCGDVRGGLDEDCYVGGEEAWEREGRCMDEGG